MSVGLPASNAACASADSCINCEPEDAVEKLPLTPGPIIPAREQLAEVLLASGRPREALREFHAAMQSAPRRRGALVGAAAAEHLLN
jgi:hypothetical protein